MKVGVTKISKLMMDLVAAIHFTVYSMDLQDPFHQCYSIPTSVFWDINWKAIDTATTAVPPLYQLWMSKHVSGFFQLWENDKELEFLDTPVLSLLPSRG